MTLWFSIVIGPTNEEPKLGYFRVTNNIIDLFYYSTDTTFSTNVLLPIQITHNNSDSDNKLITLLETIFSPSSSYRFTTNGIIISNNDIENTENNMIALFTDGNNNSRLVYYHISFDDWGGPPAEFVRPFDITLISDPSCFNEGTKILYLNKKLAEEYILIENLRIGDLVKTYKHGYKKVELIGKNPMINNKDKFTHCMYKMEKTDENGLIEDLIVTGGHCILVDNLGNYEEETNKIFGNTPMIEDKYLLLVGISNDFKQIEDSCIYTYYHFIVENDVNNDENMRFSVWANGVLTETPSKNQFMAHKYTLL